MEVRSHTDLLRVIILLCCVPSLYGGYVVTTPRKWVAGEKTQFCITLTSPATDLDVISVETKTPKRLEGESEVILPKRDIALPPGETSICDEIAVPETAHSSGELFVSGILGGSTLNYSKSISFSKDVAFTFVQTDKFLYKANQEVKFRILTVNGPYLKVSEEPYKEIWIQNPSGTRLAQWVDVPNANGLIHQSFRLSDEPEEGTYKIKVRSTSNKVYTTKFKVEEYVLPRYEVTIKPPKYVLGNSKDFTFKVCAKYTFGQPVKGNVTLKVDNKAWGNYKIIVTKESQISGCKSFIITSEELQINGKNYYAYSINANAVVKEDGTGVELKAAETSVDVSRTALSYEDISVQKFYKPELPYVGEIKVKLPDESPAADEPMEICSTQVCKNITTNSNGILKFAIPPHLSDDVQIKSVNYKHERLNEEASWRSIMYESSFRKSIKKYHSPSNSSLVIALVNDELNCSSSLDTIDFEMPVRFSAVREDQAQIAVQVISRGQIQFSRVSDQAFVPSPSLYLDESILIEPIQEPVTKDLIRGHFSIPISLPKTVSPKAKVIIWYARSDGEVISDAREIDITECLLNAVDLNWSVTEAQPGEQATLSLQAEPLSLCSLGVVDKSVELLSSKKNSLTVSSILDLADKSSVGKNENSQVDDYKYCKGKDDGEKDKDMETTVLPPVALPLDRVERSPNRDFESELIRRKRSFFPHWPFYSEDVDSLYMFDEAGVYVLSDLTLETRPCNRRYALRKYTLSAVHKSMAPAPFFATSRSGQRTEILLGKSKTFFKSARRKTATKHTRKTGRSRRSYFPETWLWLIELIPENGMREEPLTLPDTVTEWVGSTVCVHPTKGVGISPSSSIVTFKDFFIDLTLPPSVKRGEIFPVKISVFNYLKEFLPLKVTLGESQDYDILSDEGEEPGSGERNSCLPKQDKVVHSIRIRPTAVGNINLTVSASVDVNSIETCGQPTGKMRTDAVVKSIRVEIEGFVKEEAKSKYVCTQDLTSGDDVLEVFTMEPPQLIIPDSARGFVAIVGDLMGPTLDNLGGLVKMPYGCGEQNMLNFAPNIFVMKYLDATEQNNQEIAEKSIGFMEKGYQRELTYRHRDGSFSAFGERDDSGSTWLTAFVLKSFAQARPYISIDSDDLNMSTDWLKSKQLENGCFESVGKVLHKGMKGGLNGFSSGSLLTSFVLIALIEAGESEGSKTVREALFCLSADEELSNPYSLAVRSYALALAGSPDAEATITSLLALAKIEISTLHWELPKKIESSKGVGVETASYAILALLTQTARTSVDYSGETVKIIKWINNQRNGQGGFVSTQDTIVALQALAAFEKALPQGPLDLTVIATAENMEQMFTVNDQNKLLQQRADISAFPASVTFDIVGEGCVLIQTVLRYNVPDPEVNQAFSLRVEAVTEPDKGCKTKRITGCASYKLSDLKSNMAIMEFDLISGYIPDKTDLKRFIGYGTGLFKRYEVDGSVVTIYIDEFSPEEICVSFRVIREVDVENPKPGSVKVYDYYKPEYAVSEKYTLPPTSECLEEGNAPLPFEAEILEDIVVEEEVPSTTEALP